MDITNAQSLGALVRSVRNSKGLSQTQLAQQVGTTRQWLSRFEQGSNDVSLSHAFAVLEALEITMYAPAGEPETLVHDSSESGTAMAVPSTGTREETALKGSESFTPESFTPEPATPVLSNAPQAARKRTGISTSNAWARRDDEAREAGTHSPASFGAQPASAVEPEAAEDPVEEAADVQSTAVNSQETERPATYSIDADIARIANSSLFSKKPSSSKE